MNSKNFDTHAERIRNILNRYDLFFVCGAPKSGTTWLQKALDAHPELVCAGEGHFADSYLDGISDVLKSYYRQQEVVARNVYEGNPYYRHSPRKDFAFLSISFIASAFAGLDIPAGTRLVGDKTPANVEHLELLHYLFPDAKFVNIVRDGRDTLVSTFKHVERVNRTRQSIDDVDAFLLGKTGYYTRRWTKALKNASAFSEKHPGMLHFVRYEDLKKDFAGTFTNVLDFLGVPSTCEDLAKCESEASFERLSGGRAVGEENPDAFFRKGVVGDWHATLEPRHLEIFYEVGAEWLTRFGYEFDQHDPIVISSD